jgi:hypothetical protein
MSDPVTSGSRSERMPNPRRAGLLVSSGGPATGGSTSRFLDVDRAPLAPGGRAFLGFRSAGFFGRDGLA